MAVVAVVVLAAVFVAAVGFGGAHAQSLSQLEAKVKEAAVFMEKKFDKDAVSHEGCSKPLEGCSFGDGLAYGATCDVRYGKDSYCSCGQRRVSRSQEVTVYAPGVDSDEKEFVDCNTGNLAQDFSTLAGGELLFLYAGFQSGVHKSWPGQNWQMTADSAGCRQPGSTCSEYDPRFRNWYVSAATGPKNVVLVLDVSGSMSKSDRISKMKDAATSVVKTLSFADYVGIVTYSSDAQVGLAASSLSQADNVFRGNLTNYVNGLSAGGATNMEAGFDKAFGLLDESLKNGKTSNCHNVILFLSDGDITDGKSGGALVNYVNERNTLDLDARIFTYAFGDDIATTVLKDIACQNKGLYAKVPDSSDGETSLRTVMGGYYEYFATAVDKAQDARAAWAEPFLDCCGMGTITTVSWPFYHEIDSETGSDQGVRRLLGVIGSSVPLTMVGNTTLQELLDRSKKCYTVDLTDEELELLRGGERCGLWWWEWLLIAIFAIYLPLALCSLCYLIPAFRGHCITRHMTVRPTKGETWCFAFAVLVPVIGWGLAVFLWWKTRKRSRSVRAADLEMRQKKAQEPSISSTSTVDSSSIDSDEERAEKKPRKRSTPSQHRSTPSSRRSGKHKREPSPSSSSSSSTVESDSSDESATTTASLTSTTAESADSCLVCHSNTLTTELLAPCGHNGVCPRCLKRITTCPTCESPVTGTIRPF